MKRIFRHLLPFWPQMLGAAVLMTISAISQLLHAHTDERGQSMKGCMKRTSQSFWAIAVKCWPLHWWGCLR